MMKRIESNKEGKAGGRRRRRRGSPGGRIGTCTREAHMRQGGRRVMIGGCIGHALLICTRSV
jgi:hypothetical protein